MGNGKSEMMRCKVQGARRESERREEEGDDGGGCGVGAEAGEPCCDHDDDDGSRLRVLCDKHTQTEADRDGASRRLPRGREEGKG